MKFISLEKDGKVYNLWIQREGTHLWMHYKGSTWLWDSKVQDQQIEFDQEELKTSFFSPMTGRVLKVSVQKNDKVKKGQTLVILSAMKMEYVFRAEAEGQIKSVNCKEGDTVEAEQLLVEVDYV